MDRTEEQKLLQEPVVVLFGEQEYKIKPLTIVHAAAWRKRFIKLMGELTVLVQVTSDDAGYMPALSKVLLDKPDELTDLFFEYVKDLNRSEIESKASSLQLLKAIEEVVKFESPFLGAATRITRAMTSNLA